MKKITKQKSAKISKSNGKKHLVSVSGERCFWVNNGPILSNLKDLHNALREMSEEQWKHHVGKNGNDFANWVKGVLTDESCAKSLMKCKSKKGAVKIVGSTVAKY